MRTNSDNFTEVILTAGQDISVFKVIACPAGLAVHADPTDATHTGKIIGISREGVQKGGLLSVMTRGMSDLARAGITGMQQGDRYYAGINGGLTTDPVSPGAVWSKYMGCVVDGTSFLIHMHNELGRI